VVAYGYGCVSVVVSSDPYRIVSIQIGGYAVAYACSLDSYNKLQYILRGLSYWQVISAPELTYERVVA
jgi:hypothetical protein